MIASIFAGWLLVNLALAPAQDAAVPKSSVEVQAPEPARHFEIELAGSGAPEVLVWFGAGESSAAERAGRRQLAVDLRAGLGAGRGSVHLLVDLGPAGASAAAFAADFPSLSLEAFQAECLERTDSRALASYLVSSPGLVGLIDLPRAGARQAEVTIGNLADFVHIGLGLGESAPILHEPAAEEPPSAPAVAAVLAALDAARIGLLPSADPALQLGGDLWQFDLELDAPDLGLTRPDPERTYPRMRLALGLASVGTDAPPAATLVDLAWRMPGSQSFARLAIKDGHFEFPGAGLPSGVTLRVIARVPEAVGELEFALDAKFAGRATCRVLAPHPALERGQSPKD